MFNRRVYLDCAAGLSVNGVGNPSSPHAEGRAAKKKLEDARTSIARLLEVQPDDIIFTSGATESNALAILGLARAGDHVLYLPSAHSSIIENIKLLRERCVEVEELPIKNFRVDTDALQKMLRPETKLVSMEAVCGETGVIWNTREVAEVLKSHRGESNFFAPSGLIGMSQPVAEKIAFPAVLHVDASQAPLTEKITRAHFGADLLTFDGSKVGVRGIGVLVAHRTIPIVSLYAGGGQERGLRSGTESPELASAFAACLRQAALGREKFRASALRMRADLIRAIDQIPNVYINEGTPPAGGQVPNILNLSIIGRDTDYLVALLDEAGFAVSTRSACETDSETGSRAVLALTRDPERARSTLRISWCAGTHARELQHFVKALAREVAFIDSNARG